MSRLLYTKLLRKYGTPRSGYQLRQKAQRLQQDAKEQLATFFQSPASAQPRKVIIIGGGFAGLSAGYFLSQKGHKVTIYEARDRIGGRVYSRSNFAAGQMIEFGAELIGANHPFWVELAQRFGHSFNVVTPEKMFTGALLTEPLIINGQSVSEEDAQKLTTNMTTLFGQLARDADPINWKEPWKSDNATALDNQPFTKWCIQHISDMPIPSAQKELLWQAVQAQYTNNNVVSLDKQSLLGVLAQTKAGGGEDYWELTEVYRCSRGNIAIADDMAREITDRGNKIATRQPVTAISIKSTGVDVTYLENGEPKIDQADYVILATPPSVWDDIHMDAAIKTYKSQTGNGIKYMSALSSRFWVKNRVAPSGLCGAIGMSWEGSDNQMELPGRQPDLSTFCGGTYADNILNMSAQQRKDFYDKNLNAIFNGYSSALISAAPMYWPEETYTKTGYSFPAPGQVCTQIKRLNEETYQGRIIFAGEHTSTGFCGYMEGALQSGFRASTQVI